MLLPDAGLTSTAPHGFQEFLIVQSHPKLVLDDVGHLFMERVLPDSVFETGPVSPAHVGTALIDPTENNALALDTLPLVIHPLLAVGAEDFPIKEVDHARPDVRRPFHCGCPVGAVLPHLPLHRLKVCD